ncbi:Sulfotransferase cytosolic 1B member 1 [Bulinus truncatus]|nr:Sulfotransferase cytosolic 1B member 1 [Bulinus truncatus]
MASETVKLSRGLPNALKNDSSSIEIHGWRVFPFPGIPDPVKHIEDIREFHVRDDDIFLLAYPKCGTHWVWEITHMLLNQTIDYEGRCKEQVMLESPGGLTRSEQEVSPRIINSHLVFAHLPQEIKTKKTKTIHVIRNPKDTVVSMFHHHKSVFIDSEFTFSEFLEAYMADELRIKTQFDYLQQVSSFEKENPEYPIFHIFYEGMKKEPMGVMKDLARFLDVPTTDEFCQKVIDACSFSNLKTITESGRKIFPADFTATRNPAHKPPVIYRKGIVGDWKNHFTVAENERFDDVINRASERGLKFKFIYQ